MWTPFEFFLGSWEGTGKGEPGISTVQRSYELVLNGKFLQVRSKSTYEPQEKNPAGEIHEDWGLVGFDRARKQYVYRQFHVEGFVNQYVLESIADDEKTLVFVTEQIENIAPGWRAKETYKIRGENDFTEIFELAPPGGDFEVYAQNDLRRVVR